MYENSVTKSLNRFEMYVPYHSYCNGISTVWILRKICHIFREKMY